MKTLALRGLFMVLGYALAVLVATMAVCVLIGIPTALPDNGEFGSFYRYQRDIPLIFVFGGLMTALYGFPGWLLTIIVTEYCSTGGRVWLGFAGILNAVLALVLSNVFPQFVIGWIMPTLQNWLNIACLFGGLCGGIAYWAISGRKAGSWKRTVQ